MREIKFRAWSKFPKMFLDMSDACYYLLPFGKLVQITVDKKHCAVHRELDTVVQLYTGLKDRKGVEIYEGDIIKAKIGAVDFILKIEFENGKFIAVDDDDLTAFDLFTITDKCEVIGNIYENKELLK